MVLTGFVRFFRKSLNQPMGIINQDLSADIDAFMERGNYLMSLRNLRLHLLHDASQNGRSGPAPAPEESRD
jgi:hypothetical protein